MDENNVTSVSRNIVLVADIVSDHGTVIDTEYRRDLEQSDASTVQALIESIQKLGIDVKHYTSPDELATNAEKHKNDVVLTIFGGMNSRNRMALVPAICESFNLKFIGPDVYGRIIAQDKEVSKRLALDAGLRTPSWSVIRNLEDFILLSRSTYPAVGKPVLEGSSIGISQENLVKSLEEATPLVKKLFNTFDQPIILEEFVRGRETAYVAIEHKNGIHWAYSEIIVDGDPEYFDEKLFDAAEKMDSGPKRTVRNIDSELRREDRHAINRLLASFGKFGYCRVDGRHFEGKFNFLELTPDAWIDPAGQFAMAFTEKGWTYENVINAVLSSAD